MFALHFGMNSYCYPFNAGILLKTIISTNQHFLSQYVVQNNELLVYDIYIDKLYMYNLASDMIFRCTSKDLSNWPNDLMMVTIDYSNQTNEGLVDAKITGGFIAKKMILKYFKHRISLQLLIDYSIHAQYELSVKKPG